ncbi:E3 ubiquitin-protein ligase RNF126-like [Neltuma alba]|uniref:E3 ubiquitin-protein ligase RNF126-like n=1 Tax=Neltuma alba TaxID=207710 RepID=UPI0010A3981C|nr:E3 ubiquitin-protein ligase RNF126-like [Prosopis alba]
MAASPEDLQQHFCIECTTTVLAPPNTVLCPHCNGPISPSNIERLGNEFIDKYRAFQASKKPAPKSSMEKMEEFEITEDLQEQQPKCPICQEEFELGDKVKAMKCGHYFHENCSDSWLGGEKNECPICKATLPQDHKVIGYKKKPGADGSSSSSSFA